VTNRYVVQETTYSYRGKRIAGWHVFDKETGRRAKGTEPSETQATVWKLKDKLNEKDKVEKAKAAAKEANKKRNK
jgi:hypothetical protein